MRKYINGYVNLDKVVLLYIDEDFGALQTQNFDAEYVSYIKKSDVGADYKQIVSIHQRRGNIEKPTDEDDWVRLTWKNRYRREEECSKKGYFIEKNIPTYEADLTPVRRLFADLGLKVGRPRRVYLDLETDSRVSFIDALQGKARILSWALVNEKGAKLADVMDADTNDEEKRILDHLFASLDDYDQIVTWNGDKFDEPVLRLRVKNLKMQVDFRRWLFLDHMKAFVKYNISSSDSGDEKQSFALENIAQAVLGDGKHDLTVGERSELATKLGDPSVKHKSMGALSWHMWQAGGEFRKKLVDYNIQDTDLLRRIEDKTGYLEVFQSICEECNVFPESRSIQPTVLVDGLMMRLGVEERHHFVTKYNQEGTDDNDRFAGAFVMPPLSLGTLKNVHVGDFASLYPSIMVTFNISPETKKGEAGPTTLTVPATGVHFEANVQGMLPKALIRLMEHRKVWKKKKNACAPGTPEAKEAGRRSDSYKQIVNSFYGVMGCTYSRWFDKEIAESTTLSGAWLIKETLKAVQDQQWSGLPVYGDSVTGNRVIICKDPIGDIQLLTMSELWDRSTNKTCNRDKEFATLQSWTALSHLGWKPITTVIRHRTTKLIHRITTKHGQTEVTSDHSLIVNGNKCTPASFVENEERFDIANIPEETHIQTIDLYSYVAGFINAYPYKGRQIVRSFTCDDNYIYLGGWANRVKIRRYYTIGSPEMDALLRLIVAYTSDGSASVKGVTSNRYMFSVCKSNLETIRCVEEDLRLILDGAKLTGPFWSDTVYCIRSGTAAVACLFSELCGSKSKYKRFPSFVFKLPERERRLVLDELKYFDGSLDASNALSYTSISPKLVAGISYIMSQSGIAHSWKYRVSKSAWTLRTRAGGERTSRYKISHDIRSTDADEYVYDLSIEDANTFVDGIGQVLLHNTDSLFVRGPDESTFRKFVTHCNANLYPRLLREAGCRENYISLSYEKEFERLVFPITKDGIPAAKRYVGVYAHYEGKRAIAGSKPEVKGLEYKRGNASPLARKLQMEFIKMFVAKEEDPYSYVQLIEQHKTHLLEGTLYLPEIQITSSVSKPLDQYKQRVKNDGTDSAQAPYIRVAKILQGRGEEITEGSKVSYVIVDATEKPTKVIPASDYTGEFDRFYLWEDLVYPATYRLLVSAFPKEQYGVDWAAWLTVRPRKEKLRKQLKQLGLLGSESS